MFKLKKHFFSLLITIFTLIPVDNQGEMPPKPLLKEICESAKIILVAEYSSGKSLSAFQNNEYEFAVFEIKEILKGKPEFDITFEDNDGNSMGGIGTNAPSGEVELPERLRPFTHKYIKIIYEVRSKREHVRPEFEKGQKYILFLGDEILDGLYIRSEEDRDWGETLAEEKIINEIKKIANAK